ncbi:MAG: hypothetical protein N2204_08880, partial [Anaerolineae bacterium]|nr:hypothetical protein [Anaerolineae bacterium]
MKWFLRVLLVAAGIGLVAGGLWYLRSRNAAASSASNTFIQVVDVQRGSLSASITVVGELEAVQSATLSFERVRGTTQL